MPGIAICNNMVTPYTNRLFNYIVDQYALDLTVISCTAREKNRLWSERYAARYPHVILPGIEFDLPGARTAHVNVGMWSTLRRLSPEVVVINGIYPTMLVAALWSGVYRRPLVFQTDGWAIMMPQSPFHRVIRPLVINRSQALICASEKGRTYFEQQGTNSEKIFVSNLVPAWSGPASVPGFDHRRYDLVWCGRVHDERKNWPFFVSLVLELKRRFPALSVRIVGESPEKPAEIEQFSRADIDFEYSAHVPPDEISSVFASARVLTLPSRQDAWGMVCNEAMQCGTPCVVSPFTGASGELVVDGMCGFVRPLDLDQWVTGILSIIGDRGGWSAMSHNSVQKASNYSLDLSARRYVEGLNFAAASVASRTVNLLAAK